MLITHSPNNPLAPHQVWLFQADPLAPHIDVYLNGKNPQTGQVEPIKEIDINGWRVGPDLAEQYVLALIQAIRLAQGRADSGVPPAKSFYLTEADAWADGTALNLTRTELRLLQVLFHEPNQPVALQKIARFVWGYDLDDSITLSIRCYVSRLRAKLHRWHPHAGTIESKLGYGYAYIPAATQSEAA